MAKLFGTDGVRGIANTELGPELAISLGRAMAEEFSRHRRRGPRIVIGTDTRISSDMLEAALAAGLCSGGANVVRLGTVTTPAVSFLIKELGADGGAMVSASHNAFNYNGIKFFQNAGTKLADDVESRIEQAVFRNDNERAAGDALGRIESELDAVDYYVEYLSRTAVKSFRGLKMVIDCANGSASTVSPRIFRRLGAEVTAIFDEPNGVNINEGCGSTYPEELRKAVVAKHAHIGLAHDGDADRLIAVDENGDLVDGDRIMAICGLHMLRKGTLKHNTLVATDMSNMGLDIAFRKAGGRVVKTRVGDRYVFERMRREGFSLGGEQSGHIIFGEFANTGDGILTGIQLVNVMRETGYSLSRLGLQMEQLPQVLVNVPVSQSKRYEGNPRIAVAISEAEETLDGRGRVLMRPSGTEPLVRIMVEAEDQEMAERLAADLREVVHKELG